MKNNVNLLMNPYSLLLHKLPFECHFHSCVCLPHSYASPQMSGFSSTFLFLEEVFSEELNLQEVLTSSSSSTLTSSLVSELQFQESL